MPQPRDHSSARLIEALGELGVRLWSDGGRLRYAGPPGAVTPGLLGELRERKPEIMAVLSTMPVNAPTLTGISRDGDLPLSCGQQRLWFLHQMDPDDTAYHLWLAWRLRGRLDVAALERAVNGLIGRHEVLRTRFVAGAGGPRQEILDGWRIALRAEAQASEEAARRELRAETLRPFRLDEAPPVRARLLGLGDREHLLLLLLHHIVADGWSLGLLDVELWEGYRRGDPLTGPVVQYADYAAWQRRRLDGGEAERLLAYWREWLAGAPTRLDLPADRPRAMARRSAGGHRRFELSSDLTARLRGLGRDCGVTMYMTLLAAFQVLLWRSSGQPELLVGTPVSGRGEPGLERAVGFFVDTVVVRADLRGNPTFVELLTRVRSAVLDALAHQDLPFERLVDALEGDRDPGTTPLFQAVFAMQGAAPARPPVDGLEVRWYTVESETEQFELSLHVTEGEERLLGDLSYRADLYEAATAKRLLRQYRRLLDKVSREPWRRLEELALPDAAERGRVLDAGRGSPARAPARCVEAEILDRARERPDAPAVQDGATALTFAGLEERSARVAGALRALGIGPEARVGLLSERRAELVAGLLGILRSGAAAVPLDPGLPHARLEHLLRDSGVDVVVVGQPRLRGLVGARVELDCSSLAAGECWRDATPEPESLAYVMYTSGSTGQPKGVAVTRRGLARYVDWAARWYGTGGGGSLVHTSAGFDLTLTSLLVPLVRGEQVGLVPEERGLEGLGAVLTAGPRRGVLKLTPAHLQVLRRQLGVEELGRCTAAIVVGGEQLWWRAVEALPATGTRIWNEYGPTEAVVGCVAYELPPGASGEGAVPIGRPVPGTDVYVVGSGLDLVGEGAVGELAIGGDQLARGYWGLPAETAMRFVPDPWGEPGARMYRSGDLVRWRRDGHLEFLGRRDGQVKVRGHRVELGEVDCAMRDHPEVAEAAVALEGERGLVGYVVWHGLQRADDLLAWLRARLPGYMVPGTVLPVDRLPLTSNGKVDRDRLRERATRPAARAARLATEEERAVARIWAEVLELEAVGGEDGFFDLGGNSLLAIEMLSRVHADLGVRLAPRVLFEAPTLAELARLVAAERS